MSGRGLGQGELVLPEPDRRLIVAAGAGAWWGVDPSAVRCAIAYVDGDGRRGVETVAFTAGPSAGLRLAGVYSGVVALAAGLPAPGVIVVEQPSGKQANPMLSYAVGATLAALGEATGAVVETVPSMRWKAVACGRGNLYKPRRERGAPRPRSEDYAVLRWARAAGYEGRSWDEADAWGVAEYARRTFVLEARL